MGVLIDQLPLKVLLLRYRPGSHPPPWSWIDEAHDLYERVCLCCNVEGHYQRALEAHMAEHGWFGGGVLLGSDGRVWDGHHRIVSARKLGHEIIPIDLDSWSYRGRL